MPPRSYAHESEYGRDPPPARRRQREPDVDDRDRERRDPHVRREPVASDVRERVTPQRLDMETQRRSAREPDILRGAEQRLAANSGVPRQQDVRMTRNVPLSADRDDEMMYDVPRTQYPPAREPQVRRAYEGEFDEMPPQIRPVIDPSRVSRDEPRPNYNEYFLPGEGIDREVIQSEICRYLGQDATCKPGTHGDGRRGYIIRAYRALTTEMIRSLKEDSAKYARERDAAARGRRQPVPYAMVRDQARYGGGGDEMMIDEPEERDRDRHGRYVEVRNPAPASGFGPEAGYSPASAYYSATTTQVAPSGFDVRNPPRYVPGNTPPPTGSGRTSGYATEGYPPVTSRPSMPPVTAAGPYLDSRSNTREAYEYPSQPRGPRR